MFKAVLNFIKKLCLCHDSKEIEEIILIRKEVEAKLKRIDELDSKS